MDSLLCWSIPIASIGYKKYDGDIPIYRVIVGTIVIVIIAIIIIIISFMFMLRQRHTIFRCRSTQALCIVRLIVAFVGRSIWMPAIYRTEKKTIYIVEYLVIFYVQLWINATLKHRNNGNQVKFHQIRTSSAIVSVIDFELSLDYVVIVELRSLVQDTFGISLALICIFLIYAPIR